MASLFSKVLIWLTGTGAARAAARTVVTALLTLAVVAGLITADQRDVLARLVAGLYAVPVVTVEDAVDSKQ